MFFGIIVYIQLIACGLLPRDTVHHKKNEEILFCGPEKNMPGSDYIDDDLFGKLTYVQKKHAINPFRHVSWKKIQSLYCTYRYTLYRATCRTF